MRYKYNTKELENKSYEIDEEQELDRRFNIECTNHEREMLESAVNAITQLEAWEFLSNYNPPENSGFMFDTNERIHEITQKINELYGGHSGASMALTMKQMVNIAKMVDDNIKLDAHEQEREV